MSKPTFDTRNMKTSNTAKTVLIIFLTCILISIKVVSYYPDWIERNYSRGIYPYISWFYRKIFGWLPFSVGDILYSLAGAYILWKFFRVVRAIVRGGIKTIHIKRNISKAFFVLSSVYIYFNLTWGLNYNRPGIASQLQLDPQVHSLQDLKLITGLLLKKVNDNRTWLGNGQIYYKPYPEVFSEAQKTYQSTAAAFPFLEYNTRSIKRSMYGRMGNYLGFLGYYNPFTGEAQLNLTMPRFLIPFVVCHEMAHQLGYASESEANFVGYLASTESSDTLFNYSAYFDIFNYANHELLMRDSVEAKNNYNKLNALVKRDYEELREYRRKSENVVEPFIKIFYDNYLKANQQIEGLKSYDQVVGWLIAYYKKYGKI